MITVKTALIIIAAVLILGFALYAGFSYTRTRSGDLVFPAGNTYLGSSPTPIQ